MVDHKVIAARGGRSRSKAKIKAVILNLKKARAARKRAK